MWMQYSKKIFYSSQNKQKYTISLVDDQIAVNTGLVPGTARYNTAAYTSQLFMCTEKHFIMNNSFLFSHIVLNF